MPKYNIEGFSYRTPKELNETELSELATKLEAAGALHPEAQRQEINGREDLKSNAEVLNSYKTYYKRVNGKDFAGDNDELVDSYMEQMRYWNVNAASLGTLAAKIKGNSFNEQERQSIATMWDAWDRTVPWFKQNDGKWKAIGDFAEAAVTDPTNWMGLISGGTATAASVASTGVARQGMRQLLKQYAVQGAKSGALTGAAWSGGTSVVDQSVRKDVGLQDAIEPLKVLADSAIGAGAGSVLGGLVGAAQGALHARPVKGGATEVPAVPKEGQQATPNLVEPASLTASHADMQRNLQAGENLAAAYTDPAVIGKQREAARRNFLDEITDTARQSYANTDIGKTVSFGEAKKRIGELLDRLGVEDFGDMSHVSDKLTSAFKSGKMSVGDLSTFTATVIGAENKAFNDFRKAVLSGGEDSFKAHQTWENLTALSSHVSNEAARSTAFQVNRLRDSLDPLNYAQAMEMIARNPDGTTARGFQAMLSDAVKKHGNTAMGAANEFWVHNVLGAPSTIASNIFGTVARLVIDPAKRIMAGVLQAEPNWIRGALREYAEYGTGLKDAAVFAARSFWNSKNYIDAGRNYADTANQIFIGNQDLPINQMLQPHKYGYMNSLGNLNRFIGGRTMRATDEFSKQLSFRSRAVAMALDDHLAAGKDYGDALTAAKKDALQAINDQLDAAARGVKSDNPLAIRALEEARDVTFQNEFSKDVIGETGEFLNKVRNHHPLFTQLMPFIRTPIQLIEWSASHTPVLQNITEGLQKKIQMGGKAAAEAEAQVHLGTLLAASAMASVIAYDFEGSGSPDKNENKVRKDRGIDRNSVEIDPKTGKSLGFNRLDPVARHFSLAAKIKDIYKFGTKDDQDAAMSAVVLSFANTLGEMSSMAGMKQFLDAWQSDKAMTKYAGDKAGSFVPYFRLMQEINGGDYKVTETVLDGIKRNIPGLNKGMDVVRDNIFGSPNERSDFLLAPLTPVPMRHRSKDEVDKEILRLGLSVAPPDHKFEDGRLDLKQLKQPNGRSLYDRYQELVGLVKNDEGLTLYEKLRETIKDPRYNEMLTDPASGVGYDEEGGKSWALKKVINGYRKVAMNHLLNPTDGEYPEAGKSLEMFHQDNKAARSVQAQELLKTLRGQ